RHAPDCRRAAHQRQDGGVLSGPHQREIGSPKRPRAGAARHQMVGKRKAVAGPSSFFFPFLPSTSGTQFPVGETPIEVMEAPITKTARPCLRLSFKRLYSFLCCAWDSPGSILEVAR